MRSRASLGNKSESPSSRKATKDTFRRRLKVQRQNSYLRARPCLFRPRVETREPLEVNGNVHPRYMVAIRLCWRQNPAYRRSETSKVKTTLLFLTFEASKSPSAQPKLQCSDLWAKQAAFCEAKACAVKPAFGGLLYIRSEAHICYYCADADPCIRRHDCAVVPGGSDCAHAPVC